ncbi:MAG: quinone oxidoreductase [Acidobacteria bacterium]|nr:quinone oxidoreductase [Acidobacteriota bacterium]
MKAIRIHENGGPEVLRYEEVPIPAPGPAEALVKIQASGVNFIDIYFRQGLYKAALPITLGQEAAGVVEKVGAEIKDLAPGDRVAYAGTPGAYAQYAAVPAARLVKLPAGIDSRNAAAVMLQGMTAHYLATATFPLEPGHTALVHAAAGGVGLLLIQIAKMRGARVFGTVSTEEKAALARRAGADEVILYASQDFEAEVRRLTSGVGVDVVYDSVALTTWEKSLRSLRQRGMLVLYGNSSGPAPAIDPLRLSQQGSLFLTRPKLGDYVATRQELLQRAGEVLDWVAAGRLHVHIGETFPLQDAAQAQEALAGRRTAGKVLLIP